MPLQYSLDERASRVVAHASGNLTADEVIDAINAVVRRTKGKALHCGAITFLDSTTSLSAIDLAELRRIHACIEAWMRLYPGGTVKSAFVTQDPADASVLRVWKALVEMVPTIGRHVQVFPDENSAQAWISAS